MTAEPNFVYGNTVITIKEAVDAWKETLERVFKTVSGEETGSAVPEVGEEKHERLFIKIRKRKSV